LNLLLNVNKWFYYAFLGPDRLDVWVISQTTFVISLAIGTHCEYDWNEFDLFEIFLNLFSSWFRVNWINKSGEVIRRVLFTSFLRLLELLDVLIDTTIGAFSLVYLIQVNILRASTFNGILMGVLIFTCLLLFLQTSYLFLGFDQRSHLLNNITLNIFLRFKGWKLRHWWYRPIQWCFLCFKFI